MREMAIYIYIYQKDKVIEFDNIKSSVIRQLCEKLFKW